MKLLSRKEEFSLSPEGLDSVVQVTLGGINQSILIQAEDKDQPVLLILHGGPSMPIPGVSCRSRDYVIATATKELVKHYVLVFWDQRGTGKSYQAGIPPESMNVQQFINDAEELVDWLRQRFNQGKIYMAGHSWGSIIGLSLAHRIPNKFHAYIGISQIINWAENDRLCLKWALAEAQRRNHKKALQALRRLGEPPYKASLKQWQVLRTWLTKFNSMIYTGANSKHPGIKHAFMTFLRSPDYTLKDIKNTFYNGFMLSYSQQMIEDFSRIDFAQTVPSLDLPVYFLHGRHDLHIYGQPAQAYLDKVMTSQDKQFIWLSNSSHMLHPDDARQVESFLIRLLPDYNPG